jgi:hypothetical protein
VSTQEIDFTAGTDSHPNDPHVETPGRVRPVAVPPAARTLGTLPHIDYEDAFLVETGPAQDRTSEQWARAILEDAPIIMRRALAGAGSRSACGSVQLGLTDSCSAGRCGAAPRTSRSLVPAPALGCRPNSSASQQQALLFATFVQQETTSHARCGPESHPCIDWSCGTSSSGPAAGFVKRSETDER